MKFKLSVLALLISHITIAQSYFPDFFQGTWKVENKDNYEHWDKLKDKSLKGFSYSLNDGKISVSEYLDISQIKGEIFYTATVLNQNQGKGININRLAEEGQLVVAGPLGKNDNSYRGIFILNVTSLDEALRLLQTDPAIKEGLLDVELYSWYGSAALTEYLPASDKIWNSNP